MQVHPSIDKPIYLQIAEQLEDSIFTGVFPEETKIPSTNEVAAVLNINPHTVLKGMNLLVDEDIIYKKRGLGMFVKTGAVEKIRQPDRRKNAFEVAFACGRQDRFRDRLGRGDSRIETDQIFFQPL